MKRWIVLIIVGCLGSVTALDMALANPSPDKRRNLNYVSALTQNSTLKLDQVWELIENARASAKENQLAQATRLLSQAFELAQTLEEQTIRNPLLVKIIAEYSKIGAYPDAIARLSTISYDEPLPDNQGYSVRMQGEILLTQAYINEQKYEQALDYAQNLELDAAKYRALVEIITGYARQGQFAQAISLSPTLEADSYQQYLAQSAILAEYIQRHEYDAALAYVQGIPNTDNKDSIARSLAEMAWRYGRYDIALESGQIITNLSLKVTTLRNLAQALVAVGQQEKAASIVSQAFELSKKSEEFLVFDWVKDFLATGQQNQVNTILNNLTGANDYPTAYNRFLLANAYLSQGQYREAFKYAQPIPDRVLLPLAEYKDPKVELFESIIQQALEAGQYDFAQEVALTLTNKEDQVKTLQTIARHGAKMGQNNQAVSFLNQALSLAKTIESISVVPERSLFWTEPNASLLIPIADNYIALEQNQAARETLELATQSVQKFETQYAFDIPVWTKSQALRQIAARYRELGNPEQAAELLAIALAEVPSLTRNPDIIQESLAIATAYAELGNPQPGLEIIKKTLPLVETVERKSEQVSLLTTIANALIKWGSTTQGFEHLKSALSVLSTMESDAEKIPLMISLIGVYLDRGEDVEPLTLQTLEMIQRLSSEYEQSNHFTNLATVLAQDKSQNLVFQMIDKIPNQLDKTRMILTLAQTSAAQGNLSIASEQLRQALTVVNTIQDEQQRDELLVNTAAPLANLNDLNHIYQDETWRYDFATDIAQGITNPETKATISIKLALKYAHAGDSLAAGKTATAALEAAEQIEQPQQWQTQLWQTIDVALNQKRYDFVKQVANGLTDAIYKTSLLRQLAQQYAIAGNQPKALETLSQARQIATTIENKETKEYALGGIAQQQEGW
ncbi:tetratricopeptide repeat domain protein [Coleofasciculus chthonoplastes PCC 7420]|uniref:Tetratricopeptide repeat domain protein n=1 Tax=Coleofasciculus chthonoplastes PCC 7420 TaxID=118168 RepID=B4VNB7_9CYAN|nr:hypothetical protein [Coleofasciculus chthonoplastes]EDX76405.1 tetratricopeptide repeat domain protein [Coleofasciculus chthonoplastes PCC 7420]